jgi:hypothetical protein
MSGADHAELPLLRLYRGQRRPRRDSVVRKLVLLAAGVAALTAATPTASADGARHCSGLVNLDHGDSASQIIVRNIGCKRAKRIIKAPATKRGYACTSPFDAPFRLCLVPKGRGAYPLPVPAVIGTGPDASTSLACGLRPPTRLALSWELPAETRDRTRHENASSARCEHWRAHGGGSRRCRGRDDRAPSA